MGYGEVRRLEKTYFDVRVFNPHAPSNKGSQTACFKKHKEDPTNREYEKLNMRHSLEKFLIISTAHVQNDHVVQNKCDNDNSFAK